MEFALNAMRLVNSGSRGSGDVLSEMRRTAAAVNRTAKYLV